MSVNTVCHFGYGVRVRLTDEVLRQRPELDDFEFFLSENYPSLTTTCSGNAFDDTKEMTRWVFIEDTLARMWDFEAEITQTDFEPFDPEHDELLRFIIKEGLAYGRAGYAMIRQIG